VLDLHSKRLAGWSIADHMRTELVTDALEAAARTRGGSLDGAIFHSDNGAQYTSKEFANVCRRLGVTRSRGAVGTSADNAAAESFNATLKRETLQGKKRWSGAREARLAVFRWVTRYNTRRRHSALGYVSPIASNSDQLRWPLPHSKRCPRLGGSPRYVQMTGVANMRQKSMSAARWGFDHCVVFSRAFRTAYDLPPRSCRQRAQSTDV
jgi:hypothetical protein